MTIVGTLGSVNAVTDRGSGIVLMPPNFTLILLVIEYTSYRIIKNLLQANVGVVLCLGAEALAALHALSSNAHLHWFSQCTKEYGGGVP